MFKRLFLWVPHRSTGFEKRFHSEGPSQAFEAKHVLADKLS